MRNSKHARNERLRRNAEFMKKAFGISKKLGVKLLGTTKHALSKRAK